LPYGAEKRNRSVRELECYIPAAAGSRRRRHPCLEPRRSEFLGRASVARQSLRARPAPVRRRHDRARRTSRGLPWTPHGVSIATWKCSRIGRKVACP